MAKARPLLMISVSQVEVIEPSGSNIPGDMRHTIEASRTIRYYDKEGRTFSEEELFETAVLIQRDLHLTDREFEINDSEIELRLIINGPMNAIRVHDAIDRALGEIIGTASS